MDCASLTPCHVFAGPAIEWVRLTIIYPDLGRKYGNLFNDNKSKYNKSI